MSVHSPFSNDRERLILPFLGGFYERFAQPFAWTALRLAVGIMLIVEGWPKIMAPMAQVGFVESVGFHPGWFWSPALAVIQVLGGALIALGLFTRPAALACGVMLLLTLRYHMGHPYDVEALLTPAGVQAFAASPELAANLTANGRALLASDGGAAFLLAAQGKAVTNSLFWAGGAFLYAAFGGGYWALDGFRRKRL